MFTILLIVGGGGIAAYSLSTAAEFVLTGEWRVHLEKRKQQQTLSKLTDHTIVCGYGRMGTHVVQELLAQNMPFVVIEPDAEKVAQIDAMGSLALQGDASYEDNLRMAGIERARSLVSVASSDAENVFIVLTARSMRSELVIISRANSDESEEKLLRAGANRVILPYRITGRRLVALLIRPDVADFLDEVMHASQLELIVDQVQVSPESPLAGQTIQQAELRNRFGITVLACRLPNDHINTSPSAETEIQAGSYLIVLGTPEQLQQLQEVARNSGPSVF
jgi:voltage-gated potassium channel